MTPWELLQKHATERAARHGLTTDLARLRYFNDQFFGLAPETRGGSALFIGVGHGHDAMAALLAGHVGRIVGVDPFVATHGNGDVELEQLRQLQQALGVELRVRRQTIQSYLQEEKELSFDLVVAGDVLHHIFETPRPLTRDPAFPEAVALFARLGEAIRPGGRLLLSEVRRAGVRPWLHRLGVLGGAVEYATKQSPGQWSAAAGQGGWRVMRQINYVPYGLRRSGWLWRGPLGGWTVCDRYLMVLGRVAGGGGLEV